MRISTSQHTLNVNITGRASRNDSLLLNCPHVYFDHIACRLDKPNIQPDKHLILTDQDNVNTQNSTVDAPFVIQENEPAAKRVRLAEEGTQDASTLINVIHHTFVVDFNLASLPDEDEMEENAIDAPSYNILSILSRNSKGETEIIKLDVGPVVLTSEYGRIAVLAEGDSSLSRYDRKYIDISPLLEDVGRVGQGSDETLKALLDAAIALERDSRVHISSSLKITATPPFFTKAKDSALHIQLHVEASISLHAPYIFRSLHSEGRFTSSVEESQRWLINFLCPPSFESEDSMATPTMHVFLSSMDPAPPLTDAMAKAAQPDDLLPSLLPFQRRSVAWLLSREGKVINETGHVATAVQQETGDLFWDKVNITEDVSWFFNRVTGDVLPSAPPYNEPKGGILAEEPGLGKTLESISLIMLNPAADRHPSTSRWDPEGRITVNEIKTTLVVTPLSLAQQWADEFKSHAPTLKVLIYDGWKKVPVPITVKRLQEERERRHSNRLRRKRKMRPEELDDEEAQSDEEMKNEEDHGVPDWCHYVNDYDVCITTYDVLQKDLDVAHAPPVRPRREVAVYQESDRPRSPLIMVEWYRVIMDEVQMAGGKKTETMVSLIPRVSSFAVSGSPARSTVDDLKHVIKFLRYDGVLGHSRVWKRLQQPSYGPYFRALFNRIGIRTVKSSVQNELTIPEQRRYVVPIEMGRVERHVYDQSLEEALLALGMDARGVHAKEDWRLDVPVLRSSIRRLRGICTHPQVGQLVRQADKLAKSGSSNLKTMSEVFENMRDQSWRDLTDDRKARIQCLVRRAQLIRQDSSNQQRYKVALDTLLIASDEVDALCDDTKSVIAEHEKKGEVLKEEAVSRKQEKGLNNELAQKPGATLDKGKGKARENSVHVLDDLSEDDIPKTLAGDEYRRKKFSLQSRLREYLLLTHQIRFFLGDMYNVLGASYGDSEKRAYGDADAIRKELLKSTENVAIASMKFLHESTTRSAVSKKALTIEHCDKGGIKSEYLLREADEIIDTLNEQSDLLIEWRERIHDLLTRNLIASEGDADGEEYTRSLDTQGEVETYLQAYSALLADRREVLVAERTALAAHDVSERKLRHTRAAQKAATGLDMPELQSLETERLELLPEYEVLKADLTKSRKTLLAAYGGRAVKSIMVDLSKISNSAVSENDPEKHMAREGSSRLRRIIADQGALHDKLEADMVHFRKTFNDRVQYFRQLQDISDSVKDVIWEGQLSDAILDANSEESRLLAEINKSRARQRYLEYLVNDRQGHADEDDNCCILCKCDFAKGFITHCAHVFCEECLTAWFSRREGKSCPVCRVVINPDQVQRVFMRDKRIELPDPQPAGDEPVPQSTRVIDYNVLDQDLLDEIQKVECYGSHGSKIDTMVRHLLYVQEKEPGSKSIVFSAWSDSLFILSRALDANGISCIWGDRKYGPKDAAKLFRTDPGFLVLLLHGERENAGLNVTCASRVFLLESVVQHSFEIQAIARIDRMGQTRETEVYCYYAENTIERNILDLAAKKGVSLYTKDHAVGTLRVTSFDMDSEERQVEGASKKVQQKGDFILKANDMLAILFPHLYEEDEFLLPAGVLKEDTRNLRDTEGDDFIDMQPVAGASRLR